MKKKFSMGLCLLGLLFLFLGIYTFTGAYRLVATDASSHRFLVAQAVQETLKSLEKMKSPEAMEKLQAQGNVDAFNREYADLESKLNRFRKNHIESIPLINRGVISTGFVTAGLCFLSGLSLMFRIRYARGLTLGACLFFSIYYLLIWAGLYPPLEMSQTIMEKGRAMSVLIDPQSTAFLDESGVSTFQQLLFGFPFVVYHLFVITIIGGTLYILSRPKVKEFLEP